MTENQKEVGESRGLFNKFEVKHADGSPVDLNAKYVVVRYDANSEDGKNGRLALRVYAVGMSHTNKKFSDDLWKEVDTYEKRYMALDKEKK